MANCYCISLMFTLDLLFCTMGPYRLSSQLEGQETVEKWWRAAFWTISQHKWTSIFSLLQNFDRYPNSPTVVRACFILPRDRPQKLHNQMLPLSWDAIAKKQALDITATWHTVYVQPWDQVPGLLPPSYCSAPELACSGWPPGQYRAWQGPRSPHRHSQRLFTSLLSYAVY